MKQKFFFFLVPCLLWWFFALCMIFGNVEFHEVIDMVNFFGEIFSSIFLLIIFVVFLPVFLILLFCWVPIGSFVSGFYFYNWLLWFAVIALVLTIIGAAFFKFGHFSDHSYEKTGSHYEAEYSSSQDKVIIKKVNEYSGGGNVFRDVPLFFLRMIILAVAGAGIFIVAAAKAHHKK